MPQQSLSPVLRRCHRGDLAAVVELAGDTFVEAYEASDDTTELKDYVEEHFTEAKFEKLLDDAEARLAVVEIGDELVGYVLLENSEKPACVTQPGAVELSRIYLRRSQYGNGIAHAMMDWVMANATAMNAKGIWLQVYDINARARAFYRKYGFEDIGTKTFWFGGRPYDDPVMYRAL